MNHRTLSIAISVTTAMLLSCSFIQSIVQTPTTVPLLTASPIDCNQLKLTPEECVNAGIHEYSASTQILFDHDGKSCEPDNTNVIVSINFLNHDSFQYNVDKGAALGFSRKEDNRFEGALVQPDGEFEWKHTIIFNDQGFIWESDSYYIKENLHLCQYSTELIILRP